MSIIEIGGPLTAKELKRLHNNKPLTIEIKGVGRFKAYVQEVEQSRQVHRMYYAGDTEPVLMPGVVTTKLGLSEFYRRR